MFEVSLGYICGEGKQRLTGKTFVMDGETEEQKSSVIPLS